MPKNSQNTVGEISNKIYIIRGQKVMLDYDLAEIYGYTTSAFNQQVNRNIEKFDEDFMFQLTKDETLGSRSQNVILNMGRGNNIKYLPHAFTEQGIYMLMTVLKGKLATEQSKILIRTFKQMKDYIVEGQEKIEYKSSLELAMRVMKNTRNIDKIRSEIDKLDDEVNLVNQKLNNTIKKSDISPILLDFNNITEQKEYVFLDGEPMRAGELYTEIYGRAKYNIYVIDNYANIKTLRHLQNAKENIEIVIFSDNIGKCLNKSDCIDFKTERRDLNPRFIKTEGKVHDRFIVIDYGTKDEAIYHCGAFEKDAGKKLTIISEYKDRLVKTAMDGVVQRLLKNRELILG